MGRIHELARAHDAQFISICDLFSTLAESEWCAVGDVASTMLLLLEHAKDPPRCIEVRACGRYVSGDAKQLKHWLGVLVERPPGRGKFVIGSNPQEAERRAQSAYRCLGWFRDEVGAFLQVHGIELANARRRDGLPSVVSEATTIQGTEADTKVLQARNAELRDGRGKHWKEMRADILAAALDQAVNNREQATNKQGKVIAARLAELVNDRRVAYGLPPEGWPELSNIKNTIEKAVSRKKSRVKL